MLGMSMDTFAVQNVLIIFLLIIKMVSSLMSKNQKLNNTPLSSFKTLVVTDLVGVCRSVSYIALYIDWYLPDM